MDFKIVDNGNGGDLVFANGDIQLTSEVYNQPYLARFGGNLKNSTTDEFKQGEIHGDWWANALFLQGNPNEQLNSKFEQQLDKVAYDLKGRKILEAVAIEDLAYLKGFAKVDTTLSLPKLDKIQLNDNVTNDNNVNFSYIWNDAKSEIK